MSLCMLISYWLYCVMIEKRREGVIVGGISRIPVEEGTQEVTRGRDSQHPPLLLAFIFF